MKKNILIKVLFFITVLTAFGCSVRKPIPPVVIAPPQVNENKVVSNKLEVFKKLSEKQADFNTLLIKAKADLNINNNTNEVSMNIRIEKDNVIWVSVSVPIIGEVARTFITPDSIKIINKLENTYTRKPFSYIYQFTSEQINFTALQNLLIGKAITGALSESSTLDMKGGQAHIKGELSGLGYLYIFNENANLIQGNLNAKETSQTLTVNYGEYKDIGMQTIPHAISIKSSAANKNVNIDMRYTSVDLNTPLDFPFSVPKRFTVKN
jgi:hypothetical protein